MQLTIKMIILFVITLIAAINPLSAQELEEVVYL